MIESKVVLNNSATNSRFSPYTVISKEAVFPAASKISIPKNGEKITGSNTGRRVTSRTDWKGVKVNPINVFVQIYMT